ncbi:redoxin domain-containing protein [Fictibacillus nanhaiensis]|nr:redoxin domain-containing protein [Fictibacillus nanhaiensis]
MLKVGDRAPDFTLPSTLQKDISLSDFIGKKNLLVAFYPLDFTPG